MKLPDFARRLLTPRRSRPTRVRLRAEELESRLAPTVSNLTVVHTSSPSTQTVSVSNPNNLTLSYSATVVSAAQAMDQSLGLVYTGNYSQSAYGINGMWLQSTNGSNSANSGWYFLLSDGTLHQWDGGTTSATATTSPVVATFSPAVYNNPMALATAADFSLAVAQEQSLDLYFTGSYCNSSYGINADWLKSGNNSNSANGAWYFILPNGTLHQWDGVASSQTATSSPLVATLNYTFWEDPMQLLGAPLASSAVTQEQALDLQFTGNLQNSTYGLNADWLQSDLPSSLPNSNSAHGGWYFLMPNGTLQQWNGVTGSSTASSSPVVANFGVSPGTPTNTVPGNVTSPYWQEPAMLYDPLTAQTAPAGVQATFTTPSNNGGSNVVQFSGYGSLTGSFGVQVTVAGLAAPNIQDFMVTVTDQAPTLASVPSQTATYTGNLSVTLSGSDTVPNETLTYGGQVFLDSVSALAVSSGAYAQIQALGLTSYQTFSGYSGDWMLSPNGNWYILLSDGTLHQWNGGSTAAGPLIATFNSTFYTNISLLLNPAVAPGITVSSSNNVVSFGGFGSYENMTLFAVASVSDGALAGYTEFPVAMLDTSGAAWPDPQLITISFVPDGTIVAANSSGPITSTLFSTFDSHPGWTTATWEDIIIQAAQTWAQQTNINFQIVPDSGNPTGSGQYQQGDPQWGDIRISAYNFGPGFDYLAGSGQPPPINNSDAAGDISFNTAYSFNTGSTYDLLSVAIHEFGHALGLDHSSNPSDVMFAAYTGVKTSLSSNDIAAIRSIYSNGNPRTPDQYASAPIPNNSFSTAANITSQINPGSLTALLTGLDITTAGQNEYYSFTAPAGTSGTLTVNVQTTGLSLLRQAVTVYASNETTALGSASSAGAYNGTTDTITINGVTAGQVFYIKVTGADTTAFGTGAYAMTLNFGSGLSPTVPLPNTQLLNGSPLQAGGGESETI